MIGKFRLNPDPRNVYKKTLRVQLDLKRDSVMRFYTLFGQQIYMDRGKYGVAKFFVFANILVHYLPKTFVCVVVDYTWTIGHDRNYPDIHGRC